MRLFSRHLLGTIVLSMLIVCIALGGGYQLNEHGARAVGMGGAFVAQASDPSAIFFNPAGLAFQQGINVYAGGTFVMPTNKYKSPTGKETSAESQIFFPPSVYGTYAINNDLVVGIGVFTPYGLGTKWPTSWDGQLLAVETQIQTFYINPSIAYKICDQLSIGLGVSYVYSTVDLTQRFPQNPSNPSATPRSMDGTLNLNGNGNSINFDIGALYKPTEDLSIGFSFRSLTKIDFDGDAKYSNMLSPAFVNGKGKATLPLPANLLVGAAYRLSPKLTVEADFQYVGWKSYDKLDITLPAPVGLVSKVKNWDDGYLGRVGVEYLLNDQLALRGGLIYDITPQPASITEPMLPDADRVDLSIGTGYKISESLRIDAAYMIVLFSEKKSTYAAMPGTYNSIAHLISFNIGYSF